jgi:hypothetical protein
MGFSKKTCCAISNLNKSELQDFVHLAQEKAQGSTLNLSGSSRFRVGNFRPWQPMKPSDFQEKRAFPPGEILSCCCDGQIQATP